MLAFRFWQRWLLVVSVVVSVFGALMALLSHSPVFELFNRQIDPAFFGSLPVGEQADAFRQWVYGVWGATIMGWGITLVFITQHPYRSREKWAWDCLALGVTAWFLLDTALSLIARVYFNVAFNGLLFLLIALPLAFTRQHFAANGRS